MKNLFLALGASALIIGAPILSSSQAQDPTQPIAALQASGWKIVDKSEEKQQLPGLPPYESLKRVVQVVHYTLKKENSSMICKAMYDSQREHYEETCQPGSR
jgi:hypothetical protein